MPNFNWDEFPSSEDRDAASTTQPVTSATFNWDDHPEASSEDNNDMSNYLSGGMFDKLSRGLDYAGGLTRTSLANSRLGRTVDALQAYLRTKNPDAPASRINQPGDVQRALVGKAPRSAEYLERAGLPEGGALSDVVPGVYAKTPDEEAWYRPNKGGALDPTVRGAAGAGLDAATDPLSYLPVTKLAEAPGLIGKIAKALQPVSSLEEPLATQAEKAAVRHLRPTPKVADALGPERLRDIGREALDSGAIQFGNKAETTAANLGRLKDESGSLIGDMVQNSDATTPVSHLADRFENEVIAPMRGNSKLKPIVDGLDREKEAFSDTYGLNKQEQEMISKLPPELQKQTSDELLKHKVVTAQQVEELKRAWQNSINYLTDPKNKQLADMGMANVLKTEGEKMIPDEGFQSAKRAYGNQKAGEAMADRTAALTNGGTGLYGSLADLGVNLEAVGDLAHGSPAGLPIAAARGLTKGRTASMAAKTLDTLSKVAGSQYAPALDTATRRLLANPWARAVQQNNGGNQ